MYQSEIDCSADPWNIRPVINIIMAAENWLLERLLPDQKLVIVFGQAHGFHTHGLATLALLAAHQDQIATNPDRRFAFGDERSHDFAKKTTGIDIPDPHCELAMSLFNDIEMPMSSYETTRAIFGFCLDNHISVGFNDVATIQNKVIGTIDQKNAFTREIVKKYDPALLGKKIIRGLPFVGVPKEAMAISNMCMVERSLSHMERAKSRIYIQSCGLSHVFGMQTEEHDYAESLCGLYAARGVKVIPVVPLYDMVAEYFPDLPDGVLDQAIKISGLARDHSRTMHIVEAKFRVNEASGLNL